LKYWSLQEKAFLVTEFGQKNDYHVIPHDQRGLKPYRHKANSGHVV
jgi:hypothetical protein